MELVWTKEIIDNDFVHFHYECKPFVYDNKLYYAFRSIDRENISAEGNYGDKINVIEVNLHDRTTAEKCISFKDKELKNIEILLSKSWHFILIGENIYLYVGFLLDISQPTITMSHKVYSHEEFRVRTQYEFGDKYLKYNQRSTIECFDTVSDVKRWKVNIRGFIYTDIELKDKCLFFGTAGKGGAFYCINLETGQILTEYINSDSSNYEWQNSSVILKDKIGNIQQINPFTGEVLQTLILKHKLFYAPILVDNQFIYTTAYNKKSNSGQLICVRNN